MLWPLAAIVITLKYMANKDQQIAQLKRRIARLERDLAFESEQSQNWRLKYLKAEQARVKAEHKVQLLEKTVSDLNCKVEKLEAQISWFQKQLFGSKSEGNALSTLAAPTWIAQEVKRKRGKQPGTKGYSRVPRTDIEPTIELHELNRTQRCCPSCGKLYRMLGSTKNSEEIDIATELIRYIHQRCQYKKTCKCKNVPIIIAAPPAPKVIPKGLFGKGLWSEILLEKFLLQRPIQRVVRKLELHGLSVSDGTITGGFAYFKKHSFFSDISNAIKDRNRCSPFWHADETSWKVFQDIAGKDNHKWYLWGSFTGDTSVYLLDPSRASAVPETYFKDIQTGTIVCDRYSGYHPLNRKFDLAYCWSHVRRDFVKIRDGYADAAPKAQSWVERINDLFELNKLRCQFSPSSKHFLKHDKELQSMLKKMKRAYASDLRNPQLHPELAAALTSLKKHWLGLTIFAKRPEIPMDNNEAERRLRNQVVGRKNYQGSRAHWAGEFAAEMFTVLETIDKNGLDVRKWLNDYLGACAENGGKPPEDITPWLPWTMSPERKALFAKHTKQKTTLSK